MPRERHHRGPGIVVVHRGVLIRSTPARRRPRVSTFCLLQHVSQLRSDDAVLGGHRVRLLRSEEHTSELQSRLHLVCRLLLEKKKKKYTATMSHIMQRV